MIGDICQQIRHGLLLALSVVGIPVAMASPPANLSVSLDPVPFGNSGKVEFKVFPSDSIASGSLQFSPEYSYQTTDQAYWIFLNPDSVVSDPKFNSFSFDLAIKAAAASAPVFLYSVRGDPSGNFADSLADVTIKIQGTPMGTSVGTIKVPVHSAGYGDALMQVVDPNQPFLYIRLSDKNPPSITLRNTLQNFPIQITHIELLPACDQCWNTQVPVSSTIQISANSEAAYHLSIEPKLVGALLATAFILKRDSPHDVVYADITYNAAQGGISKQKKLTLNVKFTPSFWELALAVVAGALVGTILRRVLDPDHRQFSFKLLSQSLFLAAVAEFLAVVAASFDSKLVILGFDLDPRQFIPALILAVLTAGGPVVAKWAASAAAGKAANAV